MDKNYTVEKEWESHGNTCVVIKRHDMGHRCGYVGINSTHPLFGKDYHEDCEFLHQFKNNLDDTPMGKRDIITLFCWDGQSVTPEIFFNVHGSLTYAGGAGYPIEKPDTWWFGYDCGHCDDGSKINPYKSVRSLNYCIQECESLSEQLTAILKGVNNE